VGRLYWKFFSFFLLAQVVTVVTVSLAFWLRNLNADQAELESAPAAEQRLDTAAATLERDGEDALRALAAAWARQPLPALCAVDSTGNEILGRHPPAAPEAGSPSPARRVALPDGRAYTLYVDERPTRRSTGRSGGPRRLRLFPLEPLAGGVLASLLFAALLAAYVSKPIRSLRRAVDAAAHGNLGVRVSEDIGRRNDELADLGRAFDRSAAQLERLMEGQRRLLHDVSHELRSPLARLQAAVGLARQQPANVDASMERIEREAARMDRLVDELLTLSRVEAGLGAAGPERVDLVELVSQVVEDAAFEAEAGGHALRIDTDVDALNGVAIDGHPEMLHRALENVVRNAVRHSPVGGSVRLTARYEQARREVRIAIEDEGPGVSADELESIFEPFFRGSGAQTWRGHGLGLAIARRVIEAHGGTIAASNRPTGGLAVELRLPG